MTAWINSRPCYGGVETQSLMFERDHCATRKVTAMTKGKGRGVSADAQYSEIPAWVPLLQLFQVNLAVFVYVLLFWSILEVSFIM